MKIAITEKNNDKIQAAIDAVQKRTNAREVRAWHVFRAVEKIEKRLNIPKTKLTGITATIDPNAQTFPKAYKYTPESTIFCIERTKSGWTLTDIFRGKTRRPSEEFRLTLTEEAKAAIIETMEQF